MKNKLMDKRNDYNSIPMQPTQTAIEWLIEQCPRIETIVAYNVLKQAKQMEKEQMINTSKDAQTDVMCSIKCQTCGKNEATDNHPCPYSEDVQGDSESMCNCCEECCNQCACDI